MVIDLPGLILSFTAIAMSVLAIAAELTLPPRRPDWRGFLMAHGVFVLFLTSVFAMYLATRIPALDREEVFLILRGAAYATNPILAWALLRWMGDYELVSSGLWRRSPLVGVVIFLVIATVAGLIVFELPFVALVGILGGRLVVIAVVFFLGLAAMRHRLTETAAVLGVSFLFWAGLTAIEVRLDRHPQEILLLNLWYVAGSLLFGLWTATTIIGRRRRIERGRRTAGAATPEATRGRRDDTLTAREREIAKAILLGKRYQEIADEHFVSYGTVKTHVYRIYKKLGVRNKIELMQVLRAD